MSGRAGRAAGQDVSGNMEERSFDLIVVVRTVDFQSY